MAGSVKRAQDTSLLQDVKARADLQGSMLLAPLRPLGYTRPIRS